MKDRHLLSRRLMVEELETRIALSGVTASYAYNWSGYAVTAPNYSVSNVAGSWVQPTVRGSGTSYSSYWVGIDGFSSSSVEQIGTDSDLVNGTPSYYAWVEMYPSAPINLTSSYGFKVNPGDSVTADVNYVNDSSSLSTFYFTLTDNTQSETIELYANVRPTSYARSSAEWIAEAPASGSTGQILPLAPFGSVNFSSANATISGQTAAIDQFTASGTQAYSITMLNSKTGNAQAVPTALTDSGSTSSFVVNGPTSPPPASPPPPPPPTHHRNGPDIAVVLDQTTSSVLATTVVSAATGTSPSGSLAATAPSATPLSQLAPTPLADGATHSALATFAQPAWLSQAGGSSLGAYMDDSHPDMATGGQPEMPQAPADTTAPGNQPVTPTAPGRVPMQAPMPATTTPAVDFSGSDLIWNRTDSAAFTENQPVRAAPLESGGSLVEHGVGEGATTIEAAAGLVFAFALRGSPGTRPEAEAEAERRRRLELS